MYLKDIAQLVEDHYRRHFASNPDSSPNDMDLHARMLPPILEGLKSRLSGIEPASSEVPAPEPDGIHAEMASRLLENLIESRQQPADGKAPSIGLYR